MTPSELVEKFKSLESRIAESKGDFSFFALLLREDVPDRWDLILSAPWIAKNKEAAVSYVISEINSYLGPQALISLSRIFVADPDDLSIQSLNQSFHVEHGVTEVSDRDFFGLPIKHAFIITSKRQDAPAVR
jgi:hypothetical protein